MSRHRGVRKISIDYDDYDDYGYEEDEYESGRLYTAEDAENYGDYKEAPDSDLESKVAAVKQKLPSAGFTVANIREAVINADYDVDVAVALLLSSSDLPAPPPRVTPPKAAKASQAQTKTPNTHPKNVAKSTKDASQGPKAVPVTPATSTKAGGKEGESEAEENHGGGHTLFTGGVDLGDESRRQAARVAAAESIAAEDDEGTEEEQSQQVENEVRKDRVSMVVVGHVDAGKSTLMGQVLVQLGVVSQRAVQKHKREANDMGKASFYLAWVMDEDDEERIHGVTIDIARKHIESENKIVTLLDAPGHRDFVPQMIAGACVADVALLVVPATPGEFETCFESSAQTREHALLVKALGVNQIVVAVNKLDAALPPWSQARFEHVKASVEPFLRQIGFKPKKITFIPTSGLTGENIVSCPKESPLMSWYKGPSLMAALDTLPPTPRQVKRPMRIVCADVASGTKGHVVATGRLLQGRLRQGDRVLVMPAGGVATVTGVEVSGGIGASNGSANAGDALEVTLSGIEPNAVFAGCCLCKGRTPVPVSKRFGAQIAVLDAMEVPLIRGTEFQLHVHGSDVMAHCSKLIALTTNTGTVIKAKPRCATSGSTVRIQLTVSHPVCVERYEDCRGLGSIVLRQRGKTVAVGVILSIEHER